jgi:phage-related protein
MKSVHFVGTSRDDLRQCCSKSNRGKEPDDWKPMPTVGPGVQEIRVRDERGAFRVFYVAKFEEAVYVLHVFQKRSQKTAHADRDLGKSRYVDLMKWRREEGL